MSTNLKDFLARLEAAKTDFRKGADELCGNVAKDFGDAISIGDPELSLPGTPRRTGYAQGQWAGAINSLPEHQYDGSPEQNPAKRGGVNLPPDFSNMMEMKAGDRARFANNASHILGLEFGSSQKAPEGMVRIALARLQAITDRAVKKTRLMKVLKWS